MPKAVDFLKPDESVIAGQKYALINVVSPESSQKHDTCAVKIKGVFDSVDEAKDYARKLQKIDPLFDVFLVELGKWLPIPPNKEMIESQEYQDEVLNGIIKGHAEEQERARAFFEERKMLVASGKIDPIEGLDYAKGEAPPPKPTISEDDVVSVAESSGSNVE